MFKKRKEARIQRAVDLLFLEEALRNAGKEHAFFETSCPDETSRAYMRGVLVKVLAPAAKPESPAEVFFGRYLRQTAYTAKELAELDGLALRLKNIFQTQARPENSNFPAGPRDLKIYLSYLLKWRRAFGHILSGLWHGELKAGDKLNGFFPDHTKTETLNAFRSPPFPPLFTIAENEIILNEVSEGLFLFLLSGLLVGRLASSKYASALYGKTYLLVCEGVFI